MLNFVVTDYWWQKYESGEKNIEYRRKTPYWDKRVENAIKAQEQQGYIYIGASAGLIVIALKMFITAKKTDLLEKISFSLAAIKRNTAAPVQSEEPDQK